VSGNVASGTVTLSSLTKTLDLWLSDILARITSLETAISTYPQTAIAPTVSPAEGTFELATTTMAITLASATTGSSIYYTLDGSTPTTGSSLYAGPFNIDQNRTIKSLAVKAGLTNSAVTTAVFALRPVPPTFSPPPGSYFTTQTVTIASVTPGVSIYYTTDGSTPTTGSPLYTTPISVSANQTIKVLTTKTNWTSAPIASATYSIVPQGSQAVARLGMNLSFVNDYNTERFYADAVKMARTVQDQGANDINLDPLKVDADGWPKIDFLLGLVYGLPELHGTYRLEFTGQAADVSCGLITCTVSNKVYDSPTNKTTATVTIAADQSATTTFRLSFSGTKRLPADAPGTGVTNIHLWRPEEPGSATSFPGTSPFALKKTDGSWTTYGTILRKFSVLRFMDVINTNGNQETAWTDRILPSKISQSNEFGSANLNGHARGVSWEHIFAFANEVFSDAATVERGIWINIPLDASDQYIVNLARIAKCGSNGTDPWVVTGTSTCSAGTPTWPPLDPNIKLYVEYSNEIWNWGFTQSLRNQDLTEQAILDHVGSTPENFDGIVPTAAEAGHPAYSPSATYSRGTSVSYLGYDWVCNIDTGTTITGIAPSATGNTWNMNTERSIYWRRIARKGLEISNIFRSVFGDSQMMTRIRPALATQAVGGGFFDATAFLFNFYNNGNGNYWPSGTGPTLAATTGSSYTAPADGQPHPPSYYFYSLGGAPYFHASDLSTTTTALTTGNMVVSAWADEGVRPGMRYAPMFGLKHIAYEGGPGENSENQVFYDASQIKRPAVPNMTDVMIEHNNMWEDMGGDLHVYYALGGSKRWSFLPFIGGGARPYVFSADSAKIAAVDQILAVPKRAVASTYGTAIPGTATAFEWGYTTGWYTLTTSIGAADGQTNWLAYLFRADSDLAGSSVTISTTGTGTSKVYVDGVALATTDGGTTWTGPALAKGLHGVIVRAVTGTLTVNSVAVASAAPPPPPSFTDDFNRPDGVLAAPWSNPATSASYVFAHILGNKAVRGSANTSSDGYAMLTGFTVGADQYIQAQVHHPLVAGNNFILRLRGAASAWNPVGGINVSFQSLDGYARLGGPGGVAAQSATWYTSGEYMRLEVRGQTVANGGTGVTVRLLIGSSFATMTEVFNGTNAAFDGLATNGYPVFEIGGDGTGWIDNVTAGSL
jgi:hypothetical protein